MLRDLRRLLARNALAAQQRAVTAEERAWSARVQESLQPLVNEGLQVLPGGDDPRDWRRVRKRPAPVFNSLRGG